MPNIELTLFYREGCHLCDQMLAELSPYINLANVNLERIDIDEHPVWLSRYNALIPVLHVNDEPICKYYLDKQRLEAYLTELE